MAAWSGPVWWTYSIILVNPVPRADVCRHSQHKTSLENLNETHFLDMFDNLTGTETF
jgi:hypothetical protein